MSDFTLQGTVSHHILVTVPQESDEDAATRRAEYVICQRRGHKVAYGIGDWWTCKWCGVEFRNERIERNVPREAT